MEMWRRAVSGPGEEEAGVVISQKAASSSLSVVAVDGIYRHLPLSLFQTLLSITKCCSGHNLPVRLWLVTINRNIYIMNPTTLFQIVKCHI